MNGISKGFLLAAVVYGLLGMVMGLQMAISGDHGQMPTHAHIMVIGWLSFAVFGLFYQQFSAAVSNPLSKYHYWLAQVSLPFLIIGLWLTYSGHEGLDFIPAVSSIVYSVSFVLFSIVVFKSLKS